MTAANGSGSIPASTNLTSIFMDAKIIPLGQGVGPYDIEPLTWPVTIQAGKTKRVYYRVTNPDQELTFTVKAKVGKRLSRHAKIVPLSDALAADMGYDIATSCCPDGLKNYTFTLSANRACVLAVELSAKKSRPNSVIKIMRPKVKRPAIHDLLPAWVQSTLDFFSNNDVCPDSIRIASELYPDSGTRWQEGKPSTENMRIMSLFGYVPSMHVQVVMPGNRTH